MSGTAEALAAEGVEITVLQRFDRDARLERNGVTYVFHADGLSPRLGRFEIPWRLHRMARQLAPTLVHANGLTFPLQLRALRSALAPTTRLIVQDHAGAPSRRLRALHRWSLRPIDAFLFMTRDHARPWLDAGVISARQPIYEITEGSTHFRRVDRAAHRVPVLLWVGRLIPLKDPLTIVRGFLSASVDAHLYMVYADDTLRSAIPDHPAITFLGKRPHAELETIYNGADYFVLGSHNEGSGYALLEAMACGVVPVVSDIPSFRRIVGSSGELFTPGDADAFAAALRRAMARPLPQASLHAAADFEQRLSFRAIARDLIRVYT
ncbi:MAG TPA: glycosyltransferase family 4 protein [Gemmatimonadaceae bacterium]|nr:glycosyltransferase family 4 protein [Gemmatimonadaceae bacterium]